MPVVYIGIGSNLGDRHENCLRALNLLEKEGLRLTAQSSAYETAPWGVKSQPMYINLVVRAETTLKPHELLALFKRIEADMGRTQSIKWGPRIIDLDILIYDDEAIETDELVIPHPHMHERLFVLVPLSEIAPELLHPVLKKKISEIADAAGENT